ncbi:cupin domain-containing protein [Cohnella soli]|uniref:Cupin domain-containing protein n=1 Tax=Cohnella soli TaxID=425005 RepID=A0ABW0HLF4_9BACL
MKKYNEWERVNKRIRRKVFQPGLHMMSMLVEYEKGGIGPEHAHPHEQLGYVVQGAIQMTIGGQTVRVSAGEQVHVPGNVLHSVLALEDTLLLETFTPLREDLMI